MEALDDIRGAALQEALREGLLAGSLASVFSTAVMALAGQREAGSPWGPTNAESHWLWGDEAFRQDEPSWRYTGVGYLTHHLATVFWAALHAGIARPLRGSGTVPSAIAGGIATSAAAATIDYNLVPERLRPGFEHRLSTGAMVAVFAALAAGVALGSLAMRERD